jgi:hypothetical protein
MRITLSQVRSVISKVLNVCSTSDDVADYVNRACERLLYKAHYADSYARYRVCTHEACITWPRELETIEAAMIDRTPIKIRNQWFEFLGSGPGGMDQSSIVGLQLVDRGNSVAFDEVAGTDKKLAIYCDGSEDVTQRVVLRFLTNYGGKAFSSVGSVVIEGESIALPAAGNYNYTAQQVAAGGLYHVVKPVTNNMVRLYEYDTTTGALRPLAYYEPNETVPCYRNSLIPNLAGMIGSDCDTGATCEDITVIVMGKKRFIPVVSEDDLLMVPNIEAVRLGCQAIKNEESLLHDDAIKLWALAVQCLEDQSRHVQGSGSEQPMKMQGSDLTGPAVLNMI